MSVHPKYPPPMAATYKELVMNRNLLSFSIATALTIAGIAMAEDMPGMDMHHNAAASQPTTTPSAIDLGNTVCPVSGDKVGDCKLTTTYDGKIYHFCCDDCPKAFAKDPAKYANVVAADPAKYGVKK
jgi:YHS domain-containing protein